MQRANSRIDKRLGKRVRYACIKCGKKTTAVEGTTRFDHKLCSDCFGKAKDRRPHELNDLSGKEWARFSRSIETYPDTRSEKQKDHGACFPQSLAEQQIRIFTKSDQLVLDPFVGVGTTLDAAFALGRKAIGIDINSEFLAVAQQDLLDATTIKLIHDDARNMTNHIEDETVDFILTSPPYANLLRIVKGAFAYKWREHSELDPIHNPTPYSSLSEDLGNMSYEDYLDAVYEVMRASFRVLKKGAYAVWVVKDFRDLKRKVPYVNLHGHVIECAETAGFTLWDIRIYDQTKFRPLVCLGYPSSNFYLNIGHSYLITLRKRID